MEVLGLRCIGIDGGLTTHRPLKTGFLFSLKAQMPSWTALSPYLKSIAHSPFYDGQLASLLGCSDNGGYTGYAASSHDSVKYFRIHAMNPF